MVHFKLIIDRKSPGSPKFAGPKKNQKESRISTHSRGFNLNRFKIGVVGDGGTAASNCFSGVTKNSTNAE